MALIAKKLNEEVKSSPDKLWFWLADEVTEFESKIADQLQNILSANKLFFVRLFSWDNSSVSASELVKTCLPAKAEFPNDRKVSFFHIGQELKVKIPFPTLTHMNEPDCVGNVNISSIDYQFSNQTIIVIACSQEEHDAKNYSLNGTNDVVGYLSLMLGKNILHKEIFSNYFCVQKKKFISGDLELKTREGNENKIFGLKKFYNIDKFSGEDEKIHAALWFAGKAFVSNDSAVKVVFYKTALELLAGKTYSNFFGKIYQGETYDRANKKIKQFKDLRDNLLHKGKPIIMTDSMERYIQVFLLDAIAFSQKQILEKSAFEALYEQFQ